MRFESLESIPSIPAIAIYGLTTSCTAAGSWERASMRNMRAKKGGMYVLDLGCGLGGASRYLPSFERPFHSVPFLNLLRALRALAFGFGFPKHFEHRPIESRNIVGLARGY